MKGPFLKSSLVVVEDCHLPGGEGGKGVRRCGAVWGDGHAGHPGSQQGFHSSCWESHRNATWLVGSSISPWWQPLCGNVQ